MPPPSQLPTRAKKVVTKSKLNPNVAEFKPTGMTEEEIVSKIGKSGKVSMVAVPDDYEPPMRKKRSHNGGNHRMGGPHHTDVMPLPESGDYHNHMGTTYYNQPEYSHGDGKYCQCESCCGIDYYNQQDYYHSDYYNSKQEVIPPAVTQPPAQVSVDGTEWIHDPYAPVEVQQNSHSGYNEPPHTSDDYYNMYSSYPQEAYASVPQPEEYQTPSHTHTIEGPVAFQGPSSGGGWDEHRILPGLLPAVVSAVTTIIVMSHTACHKTAADVVREGLKKDIKLKQSGSVGVGAIKKLLLSNGVTVPTQPPKERVTILNRNQPMATATSSASTKGNTCPEGTEALAVISGMLSKTKPSEPVKEAKEVKEVKETKEVKEVKEAKKPQSSTSGGVDIVTQSELVQRIQEKAYQELQKEKQKREQQREEQMKKVISENVKKAPTQRPVVLQKKEKTKLSNNSWKEVATRPARSANTSVAPVSVVPANNKKGGGGSNPKHANRLQILTYANSNSSESDPRSCASSVDGSTSDGSHSGEQPDDVPSVEEVPKSQPAPPTTKKVKKGKHPANDNDVSEDNLLLQLSAIQKNRMGAGTAATSTASSLKGGTPANAANNNVANNSGGGGGQNDATKERQKKLQNALVERWKAAEEEERLVQEQTYRAMQHHKHDLREKADRDLRDRQKEADRLISSGQHQQALNILRPIYSKMTDSDHAHDTFTIATTVASCLLNCDQRASAYSTGTAVVKLAKMAENAPAVVTLSIIVAQVAPGDERYTFYRDACQGLSRISGVKAQSEVLTSLRGLSQSIVDLGITSGLSDFHLIKCLVQLATDSAVGSIPAVQLSQMISLENSGDWDAVINESTVSPPLDKTSKLIVWCAHGMNSNWSDVDSLAADLEKFATEVFAINSSDVVGSFTTPPMAHSLALMNFAARQLSVAVLVSQTCELAASAVSDCDCPSARSQLQFVTTGDSPYPHFVRVNDTPSIDDFTAIVPSHHKQCWRQL